MLKMFTGIIRLPLILVAGFISFWLEIVSKIAFFIVAIINIGLLVLMVYCGFKHDWLSVGIALAISFILFAGSFVIYAVQDRFNKMTGFNE